MPRKNMTPALEEEYIELMSAYLQGHANVAKLRRLNELLAENKGLAEDLDSHIAMNMLLSQYGAQKRAEMSREAAVKPVDSDEPIPLLGPRQPSAVICVFTSGGGQLHPHMRN